MGELVVTNSTITFTNNIVHVGWGRQELAFSTKLVLLILTISMKDELAVANNIVQVGWGR